MTKGDASLMSAPYSSGRRTPTLTNPIPASWEQLCALSSRPGEMPPGQSPEGGPSIRPEPTVAAPAPVPSAFRAAEPERREPSFHVPDFRTAVPEGETVAFFAPPPQPTRPDPAARAPQPRPQPQPRAEAPQPRPARETYFSAGPQAAPQSAPERDETVALLQAAIERAVLEEIRPALQAAARRAAAELEADALRLAAPAVRDAVAQEFARFMRK